MFDLLVSVRQIEDATGLKKEVLRKWESRYGFPRPVRDDTGRRAYPADQIRSLKLINRLLSNGMRPNKVVGLSYRELLDLAGRMPGAGESGGEGADDRAFDGSVLQALREHDGEGLKALLQERLQREGLSSFVQDTLTRLNASVGDAWLRGELRVFEEHLYSQAVTDILHNVHAILPARGGRPRILLTTPSGELHAIGLMMARALLTLDGAQCCLLGAQTPAMEVVAAAKAMKIDVVGISASGVRPWRELAPYLGTLRSALPATIPIWLGGRGADFLPSGFPGVTPLHGFADALAALKAWRAKNLDVEGKKAD